MCELPAVTSWLVYQAKSFTKCSVSMWLAQQGSEDEQPPFQYCPNETYPNAVIKSKSAKTKTGQWATRFHTWQDDYRYAMMMVHQQHLSSCYPTSQINEILVHDQTTSCELTVGETICFMCPARWCAWKVLRDRLSSIQVTCIWGEKTDHIQSLLYTTRSWSCSPTLPTGYRWQQHW